jgi:hypothetical protein
MAQDSSSVLEDVDEPCATLLQQRMEKEMNSKLEELNIVCEPSVPFVRVLLGSSNLEDSSNEAILTVWNPTSEQLDMLREGAVLRMHNLDPKITRFEGLRQFVGHSSSRMFPVASGSSQYLQARNNFTLFSVILASKAYWMGSCPGSSNLFVDIVGVVLDVKHSENDRVCLLYVTDKSHLVVRIQCDDSCEKFMFQVEDFKVMEFHDLRVMPFDHDEGYAVLQYCKTSRFIVKPNSRRVRSLVEWSTSMNGSRWLEKLRAYASIGLPLSVYSDGQNLKAIGFIAGMNVLSSHPEIVLLVECGSSYLQCWKLPLALVPSFAVSCIELNKTVVLNSKEEWKLSQLTKLGHVYRARKVLFCFSLRRNHCVPLGGNCAVEFDVAHISSVDTKALASMFSAVSC